MATTTLSASELHAIHDICRETEAREREVARLFPDTVVERIAVTLPRFVNEDARAKFADELRGWAGGYMSARQMDARRNVLHFVEDAQLRLRKAADDLVAAYEDIGPYGQALLALRMEHRVGVFDPPTERAMAYLTGIVHGARLVASAACDNRLPRRGRPKDRARHIAVMALVTIYRDTTGDFPTLNRDPYVVAGRGHYGPFRNFCIAALTPIEGQKRAQVGIDALITRILYIRK